MALDYNEARCINIERRSKKPPELCSKNEVHVHFNSSDKDEFPSILGCYNRNQFSWRGGMEYPICLFLS